MFTLQKLFGKDDKFFDLLEASAQESQHSVQALNRVLSNPARIPSLTEFHESKEADKRITEQIGEALINSFVAELEREDIEALSAALYKIPKTVEKFAERFILSSAELKDVDFLKQVSLLEQAIEIIVGMLKDLSDKPQMQAMASQNAKLQRIEG